MNTTLKVTKEQKAELESLLMKLVCDGIVHIENNLQHKCAEILVKSGSATVTKKKNYGRIVEIKAV